jgi:CO/xanthine dehydrogenase FAD-binding subunit
MSFVLSLSDFGMWLAASSLIMLTAVELTSPLYDSSSDVSYNRKKIRRVAFGFAIAFVAVALIRITFLVL